MKIHNPTDFELNAEELRAIARRDLDPVRRAVEEHRERRQSAGDSAGKQQAEQQRRQREASNVPARSAAAAKNLPARGRNERDRNSDQSGDRNKTEAASQNAAAKSQTPQKTNAERREELEQLQKQQRQLIEIIRQCEPLEVLNYDLLALKGYPDGVSVLAAKRRRDFWLLLMLLNFGLFLIGWQGMLPAWVAGIAFGLLVMLAGLAVPSMRRIFLRVPSHRELIQKKKQMEFRAMSHIRMLESSNGLAYQCQMMIPYRRSLSDKRFSRIVLLSRQKSVIKAMRSVAAIRLYLMYILEAQQAFNVVKQEYMKVSSRIKTEFQDLL